MKILINAALLLCAPYLGAQTQAHKFELILGSGIAATNLTQQTSADITLQGIMPKKPFAPVNGTLDLLPQIGFKYAVKNWFYIGATFWQSYMILPSDYYGSVYTIDSVSASLKQKSSLRINAFMPNISLDVLPNSLDEHLFVELGLNISYISWHSDFLTEIDKEHEDWNNFVGSGTETYNRSGWAFGWQLGVRWVDYFSEHWGYSVYFNYQPLKFEPNKMKITKYILDGNDLTNDLTTRQREYNFGSPLDDDASNPNAPTELDKEHYQFRTYVLGVGVQYRF